MRSLRVLSIVAACVGVVGSANAVILWDQPSDTWQTDPNGRVLGVLSDALASNGTYFNGQTVADNFTVGSGGWNASTLRFWGASEGWFNPDLRNVTGFEINIMSPLGSVLHNWVVQMSSANLTKSTTGRTNLAGADEYEFNLDLVGLMGGLNLAAGTYYLNIGSVNADGQGDGWAWSNSDSGGADLVAYHNYFDGQGWVPFTEQPTDLAFQFIGPSNAVPEPFTMALGLGAAGAYVRRRRRK